MKKFRRKKLALALACASILGGKTQAIKEPQSQQIVAAVGGATTKNSSKGFVNWIKNHKWQLGVGIGAAAVVATTAILGVKYLGKKDNGSDPSKDPNAQDVNKDNPQKNKQIEVGSKKETKDNKPNEKKDYQIQNEENNPDFIKIEEKIVEKKIKNLDLIKNKINDIKVENKHTNDKNILINAFKYFGGIIAKNSLEELSGLFDYIRNYNEHEGPDAADIDKEENKDYKAHFDNSKIELRKIFYDNSEISNVMPEFVFREGYCPMLNIKFNFDGKNRKIELLNYKGHVRFSYYYNVEGEGEAVVFKVPCDKLGM